MLKATTITTLEVLLSSRMANRLLSILGGRRIGAKPSAAVAMKSGRFNRVSTIFPRLIALIRKQEDNFLQKMCLIIKVIQARISKWISRKRIPKHLVQNHGTESFVSTEEKM